MIMITPEQYSHFLKQEVQLIKYKETCISKSAEIKSLQTKVSYFKKEVLKLRNRNNAMESDTDDPVFANVIH